MANNKYIVGLFDHEDKLISAIRTFRKENVKISDTLTPFPVHGLEDELGYDDTRLHTAGFLFGITGTFVALSVMTFIMTTNYPINFAGKPNFALPSFIPITFELTVLFASVGMVMVYCIRNGLFPGAVPRILDERITDDRFALSFELDNETTKEDINKIVSLLNGAGAVEVKAKEFTDDTEIFEVETNEVDSLLFGASEVAEEVKPLKEKTKTKTKAKVEARKVLSAEEVAAKQSALLSVVGTAKENQKDDLKLVKGIGPVYEGKLNELGIFTFGQIAGLNNVAIEAIEDLTGFPGRVEREDWVGQAKKLTNK